MTLHAMKSSKILFHRFFNVRAWECDVPVIFIHEKQYFELIGWLSNASSLSSLCRQMSISEYRAFILYRSEYV